MTSAPAPCRRWAPTPLQLWWGWVLSVQLVGAVLVGLWLNRGVSKIEVQRTESPPTPGDGSTTEKPNKPQPKSPNPKPAVVQPKEQGTVLLVLVRTSAYGVNGSRPPRSAY